MTNHSNGAPPAHALRVALALGAALVILIPAPVGLSAQQARFNSGVASGRDMLVRTEPAHNVPDSRLVPTHPTVIPGSGTAVPRGSVVFAGPPHINIAPRHEPRTPTHPVLTPGAAVVAQGTGRFGTALGPSTRFDRQPGIRIIQPGFGTTPAGREQNRRSRNQPFFNTDMETHREQVIARFGWPMCKCSIKT